MATFEELFAGRNLTRAVQNIKSGLPLSIPPAFMVPTDPRISGNVFQYPIVEGQRDLARLVSQGSPAVRVGHQGVKWNTATMLRSFESQAFTGSKLVNLVSMGNDQVKQNLGAEEVARQTRWFKQRQVNLMQTSVQLMLYRSQISYNAAGQILNDTSGAVNTVDAGIAAGQKDQLNVDGTGAIIGASWNTASTDIVTHLAQIKDKARKLGGWELTYAFYGKNIPGYIAKNTTAKEWINRDSAQSRQAFAANKVPQGFQDFNWYPAGDAFFPDNGGTMRTILGDDEIVFTPEPSDDWWRLALGSEPVPGGVMQVGQSAADVASQLEEVFGMFSYATLGVNPVSIEQFAGNNWLPVITAKYAWYKATVHGF